MLFYLCPCHITNLQNRSGKPDRTFNVSSILKPPVSGMGYWTLLDIKHLFNNRDCSLLFFEWHFSRWLPKWDRKSCIYLMLNSIRASTHFLIFKNITVLLKKFLATVVEISTPRYPEISPLESGFSCWFYYLKFSSMLVTFKIG